jgi:hypothetical protein
MEIDMNRRFLAGCIGLLLLFAGCASNPKMEAIRSNLKKMPTSTDAVSVPNPMSYKFVGAFGKVAEVNLLPGSYHLEWQNDFGRLYIGQRYSVWWKIGEDFVLVPGGVWIPRDPADAPRFYFYLGRGEVKGKSLDDLLSKLPSPSHEDPAISVIAYSVQNPPVGVSPMAAGVGAGIAMAIVGGMINDVDHIQLYGEPLPESVPALRAGIVP